MVNIQIKRKATYFLFTVQYFKSQNKFHKVNWKIIENASSRCFTPLLNSEAVILLKYGPTYPAQTIFNQNNFLY